MQYTTHQVNTDFKKLYDKLGFKIPLNGAMTAYLGRPVIDILRLEEKMLNMNRSNPDFYDKTNCSFNDFVIKKYGQETLEIIDKYI